MAFLLLSVIDTMELCHGVNNSALDNQLSKLDFLLLFHNRYRTRTYVPLVSFFLMIPFKATRGHDKKQLWLCSVKYIKIAEKYLQNLEPLHKNVLDNEPRVQMSFNHEKTVLKVLSNCLFKAERKPLKPKAKQAQMGYDREKRGSKFSQSCPFK